ncbi:MAG: 3-hydroxyacyl-CoA dehydrogenase NAD-binding domain-containing protein [Acidobacteriota bacterium]
MRIEKYAVIGGGNMGAGIAQKIATEGFPVVLVDLDDGKVAAGMERIRATLAEGVARRLFTDDAARAIGGRVAGTADWSALADADLVIEAVFEDLAVKRDVFRRLGQTCDRAILATNTSSFYVRDLAAAARKPERVVGLHYFYHPAKNRLVEVIGHDGVDREILSAAWSAQEAIGKTPIGSADRPGFVVNRFFVPWLNEAVRIHAEGLAGIPTIDAAAKAFFQIGMGPFELMNVTGVPIAFHAATTLGRELGPFYAPAPALEAQATSGRPWDLAGEADAALFDAVSARLCGVVLFVAASLVEEGVGTIEDVDIGARVGLRWTMGPFQLVNQLGTREAAGRAASAVEPFSLRLPALLSGAPASGLPIHLVASGRRGKLASIAIQRPDAMNALNPEVVAQLERAVADAPAGEAVVIGGSGKAFVAGADIKFFVDCLSRGRFDEILAFTRRGAELLARLSGGTRPFVARVHGLSLGGGSELALACDGIAATPKASFGFPETGLGIYPGLGGIPRLARRIGTPLAKYFVYSGLPIDAATALALGLVDDVAPFDALDACCEALAARGASVERRAPAAPRAGGWDAVWDFFARHTMTAILDGSAESADPRVAAAVKRMKFKSRHALLLSERLFDEGQGGPLLAALELDLRYLEEAFAHPDAMEGLSALLENRRPSFR